MTLSPDALWDVLTHRLSPKRAAHSRMVAKETDYLAQRLGLSSEDAHGLHLAALLHDLTKEEPFELQKQRLLRQDFPLTEDDLRSRETLHALSGYVCAKEEFGLAEPYAHAILYHSTGGPDAKTMDKILFCADYMEESRPYERCQSVRAQVHEALDKQENLKERLAILNRAVYTIANATLEFLTARHWFIHPNTLTMRNSLIPPTKGQKA